MHRLFLLTLSVGLLVSSVAAVCGSDGEGGPKLPVVDPLTTQGYDSVRDTFKDDLPERVSGHVAVGGATARPTATLRSLATPTFLPPPPPTPTTAPAVPQDVNTPEEALATWIQSRGGVYLGACTDTMLPTLPEDQNVCSIEVSSSDATVEFMVGRPSTDGGGVARVDRGPNGLWAVTDFTFPEGGP